MKTFFSVIGVLVIGFLVITAIWSTHDTSQNNIRPEPTWPPVRSIPVESDQTAPPVRSIPVESDQTARYRKACTNEKYLADRRKFADFTTQDLKVAQACKQLGFWLDQ